MFYLLEQRLSQQLKSCILCGNGETVLNTTALNRLLPELAFIYAASELKIIFDNLSSHFFQASATIDTVHGKRRSDLRQTDVFNRAKGSQQSIWPKDARRQQAACIPVRSGRDLSSLSAGVVGTRWIGVELTRGVQFVKIFTHLENTEDGL